MGARTAPRSAALSFPSYTQTRRVLELGAGSGSWTRAILAYVSEGEVHAVDFQDIRQWINPSEYEGRLICYQVNDFDLTALPDAYFDIFFSFGVLCHHTVEQIRAVLKAALPKMRRGGIGVHEYAETNKFYRSGRIMAFPDLMTAEPEKSWWPPNSLEAMAATAEAAGWTVIEADMELFERDGMALLKAC